MNDLGRQGQRDAAERWNWVWHVISLIVLVWAVLLMLTTDDLGRSERFLLMALYAALALWYSVQIVVPVTRFRRNLHLSVAYFVVLLGIWAALVRVSPANLMLIAMLAPSIYLRLPISWAIIASAVMGILSVVMRFQPGQAFGAEIILSGLLVGLGMIPMGLYIDSIIRQSSERRRLIEELSAAKESLAQVERQAGAMGERQRLSHEIHDRLAQGYTSIVMQLETADALFDTDPASARRSLLEARDAARSSLEETRSLIWALRPDLEKPLPLAQRALPDAVKRLSTVWGEANHLPVETRVTGEEVEIPTQLEAMLLRAVREALNNVARHSGASEVSITLSYMDDVIALDVQDNGQGVQPNGSPGGGFGLQSLRQSVEQAGGELILESAAGEGTTLGIVLPLTLKVKML
jgi:signal transduction histidine kinase